MLNICHVVTNKTIICITSECSKQAQKECKTRLSVKWEPLEIVPVIKIWTYSQMGYEKLEFILENMMYVIF